MKYYIPLQSENLWQDDFQPAKESRYRQVLAAVPFVTLCFASAMVVYLLAWDSQSFRNDLLHWFETTRYWWGL